jgi:hypothetical protein
MDQQPICATCQHYAAWWRDCGKCTSPKGAYDLPVTPDCGCRFWQIKTCNPVCNVAQYPKPNNDTQG